MMIKIQSPTRVDLAGGTLDCWPLYLMVGDCMTVNLAIDVMTGCELNPRSDKKIEVEISDLKFKKSFADLGAFLSATDPELLLVQKVLDYFRPADGFNLKTSSQSPLGGGLGGSSSLCITLIKAFNGWLGHTSSLYEMVTLASNLEARVIKTPTGTQDYFPAIQPGLNIIHYRAAGVKLEPLSVPLDELGKNLLLIYTGRSHHSGINNWQVIKSVIEGDSHTLQALREIAQISAETAEACRQQQWSKIPQLFRFEFDSRVKLTASFTSPEIERLKKLTIAEGADAVKICGAGGGGCVLVWAEPKHHERIISACQKNGFQPIKIRPVTG
jgi:D-glycero-alpha-D-manno-heptose-7-phosphate kinase